MQRKITCALAAFTVLLGGALTATAEPSAEDAKDYRAAIMTSLKGHIVASSMIVRGLIDNDGYLVEHAKGLENSVGEIHRVFQHGSNVDESKALPGIWEDAEKFAAAIAKSEEATVAFTKAAASGDAEAIGGAFRNVGMSCSGCHDDFRMADD